MRHFGYVLGALVLFAASANAQSNQANSIALSTSAASTSVADQPIADNLYTAAVASTPGPSPLLQPARPDPAPQVPGVQSVFQSYNWQAYFGYTFYRFYVTPHFTNDMNGLNLALTFYPGGKWIGADGEFVGTFGAVQTCTSKFVLGMGGPRVRWLAPHNIEVWGHGLVGYSHYLPQTAYGSQSAFTFEAGAGVDLNVHGARWALRLAGDVIGSSYFNTHQYSPKVSAGVVLKF